MTDLPHDPADAPAPAPPVPSVTAPPAHPAPRRAGGPLVVAAAAIAAFAPWLGARDLWAPDEPLFAVIGRDMLRSGDWVLPRMNGEPIALLPPLTYWLVAAFSAPLGAVTETTARAGLLVSGIAALIATYCLGARIGGTRRAGLCSAAVLASTAMFCHQVRYLQADIHLFAGTTCALALFHAGHAAPDRRRVFYPLMGVAIAWAILAKGPLGFVVPGLVVLVFLLARRELMSALLRRPSFWAAVGLCAAVVLPWYLAACARGGEAFARQLFLKQNVERFFDTWSHERPVWYYLERLPEFFLPWTLLAPAAIVHLLRRRSGDEAARRDRTFLLAWAISVFVFFTLSDSKQAKYLLPMYPALAIAVGLLWAELPGAEADLPRPDRLVRAPGAVAGGLIALAGAGLVGLGIAVATGAVAFGEEAGPIAVALWPTAIAAGGLLLLPAGVAVSVLIARGRHGPALATLTATVLLGATIAQATLAPALDEPKSARALCAELDRHAPPDAPLGILFIGTTQHGGYIFYGDRRIVAFGPEGGGGDPLEELWAYLRREERVFVLTEEETFPALLGIAERPPMHELFRSRKGSRRLVVFSNRPPR